jgi:hypothetical protein
MKSNADADTERFVTQKEAARILGVEPRTLETWRLKRIGPPFFAYSRRCVRYRLSDLQEWLSQQAVPTASLISPSRKQIGPAAPQGRPALPPGFPKLTRQQLREWLQASLKLVRSRSSQTTPTD